MAEEWRQAVRELPALRQTVLVWTTRGDMSIAHRIDHGAVGWAWWFHGSGVWPQGEVIYWMRAPAPPEVDRG